MTLKLIILEKMKEKNPCLILKSSRLMSLLCPNKNLIQGSHNTQSHSSPLSCFILHEIEAWVLRWIMHLQFYNNKNHHLSPYSILCASPWGPHPNDILSWDSQMRVPKFSFCAYVFERRHAFLWKKDWIIN